MRPENGTYEIRYNAESSNYTLRIFIAARDCFHGSDFDTREDAEAAAALAHYIMGCDSLPR